MEGLVHVHAASQQVLRSRDERGAAVPEKKCGRYFNSALGAGKGIAGVCRGEAICIECWSIDTITRCRTGRKLIPQGIKQLKIPLLQRHKSNAPTVAPEINLCSICLAITERILSI